MNPDTSDIPRLQSWRRRGFRLPSFLDGLVDQWERTEEAEATYAADWDRAYPPTHPKRAARRERTMKMMEANKQ